jgi:hypothetical protein
MRAHQRAARPIAQRRALDGAACCQPARALDDDRVAIEQSNVRRRNIMIEAPSARGFDPQRLMRQSGWHEQGFAGNDLDMARGGQKPAPSRQDRGDLNLAMEMA